MTVRGLSLIKEKNLHNYKATLVRIVDADTIEVDVQLGFYMTLRTKIRLLGIDAPERFTDEGKAATAWLANYIPLGHEILLDVFKGPEKYGRWLAYVTYNGVNVNEALVKSGHAVEYGRE